MSAARTVHLPVLQEEGLSRDQRRSRRHDVVQAKTVSAKRLTKRELEEGRRAYPEKTSHRRPKRRSQCIEARRGKDGSLRPCPFVSCRHHLYLSVNPRTGAIKLHFPHLEPHQMRETCSLDVADAGGQTDDAVALLSNLTRQRVHQIEVIFLEKLRAVPEVQAIAEELYEDEPTPARAAE